MLVIDSFNPITMPCYTPSGFTLMGALAALQGVYCSNTYSRVEQTTGKLGLGLIIKIKDLNFREPLTYYFCLSIHTINVSGNFRPNSYRKSASSRASSFANSFTSTIHPAIS